MRRIVSPRLAASSSRMMREVLERYACTPLLLAAMALTLPTIAASAQPSGTTRKLIPHSRPLQAGKTAARKRHTTVAQQPPMPEAPPAPPRPQWPANDPPAKASVVLNDGKLSIDAKNSSLQQILRQVADETGAQVEGFEEDERVFGEYGPGRPRDVIAELLEGTGYNMVMFGEPSQGKPLQVVLSERPRGGSEPNAPVSAAEIEEAPYRPPEPIMRPNEPPHSPQPRTPQQILQEMQQRQEQIRQEQMRLQQMREQQNNQ